MSATLPGELRWDPAEARWYVRCVECPECWGLARSRDAGVWAGCGADPETAALYLTERGWRCIDARWHCPGCARVDSEVSRG